MRILTALIITCVIIFNFGIAYAELGTPSITHAAFDSKGRLHVRTTHSGYEGCYLAVYGGLKRSKVDTVIIARQLSAAEASSGKASFATKRRYYCKRRTLYVDVELVCLSGEIGQYTSDVSRVSVPAANVR